MFSKQVHTNGDFDGQLKRLGKEIKRAMERGDFARCAELNSQIQTLRRASYVKPAHSTSPFQPEKFKLEYVSSRRKELWRANIGHPTKQDAFIDSQAARQKLEWQSHDMVARLLKVHRETEGRWGDDLRRIVELSLVCTVNDVSRELPSIANQVFLPIVAHNARRELIRRFQLWMENHKNTRYYVATTGERCGIGELPARLKWGQTRLSELKRWLDEHPEYHGIEPQLRCDEFTLKREADGFISCHPHLNLAIHFPFLLGGVGASPEVRSAAFRKFKERLEKFWGYHIADNGEIKNPRELIKYCVKYEKDEKKDGTIGLLDLTDIELAELYAVRKGFKPVQCLGAFREFSGDLRRNRIKVQNEWIDDLEQTKLIKVQMPAPVRKEKREELFKPPRERDEVNVLVAITDPSPLFDPIAKPGLVVRNFNGDYDALRRALDLYVLRDFVTQCCENRALERARKRPVSYCVHTFTETPDFDSDENPPDCIYDNLAPPEMVVEDPNHHLESFKL